jgi:hypothetical protein
MNHHSIHADVRSIEQTMINRRPTPVRDVALALAIGLSLAWMLIEGLTR